MTHAIGDIRRTLDFSAPHTVFLVRRTNPSLNDGSVLNLRLPFLGVKLDSGHSPNIIRDVELAVDSDSAV